MGGDREDSRSETSSVRWCVDQNRSAHALAIEATRVLAPYTPHDTHPTIESPSPGFTRVRRRS